MKTPSHVTPSTTDPLSSAQLAQRTTLHSVLQPKGKSGPNSPVPGFSPNPLPDRRIPPQIKTDGCEWPQNPSTISISGQNPQNDGTASGTALDPPLPRRTFFLPAAPSLNPNKPAPLRPGHRSAHCANHQQRVVPYVHAPPSHLQHFRVPKTTEADR
jgi:hypothetical protein